MGRIIQVKEIESVDRNIRAENLMKETKILNIARLAKILVDLFGSDKPFKKIGKREGQEIEMYLKEFSGYITFILSSERKNFECRVEKATKPAARIIIDVKEEKVIKVLSSIIRSKSNIFGLLKLSKFILPGKIKIRGSYIAVFKLVRCLMIGKHEVYKNY